MRHYNTIHICKHHTYKVLHYTYYSIYMNVCKYITCNHMPNHLYYTYYRVYFYFRSSDVTLVKCIYLSDAILEVVLTMHTFSYHGIFHFP